MSIADLFNEIALEMQKHMVKEERVLFPLVKEMEDADRSLQTLAPRKFGTVRSPIRMMEHEHDNAGSVMRKIRKLSYDYTAPDHACHTFRVAYAELEEFENDLHEHIHLENNILFPKATALEKKISLTQSVNRGE
ncbi:MAG: hypothetical protein E2O85_00450 [Bacteroidetes bacterium]|nr:MAG: hypothetical protein E2O85_00450 [Bacteroidota bacterium]